MSKILIFGDLHLGCKNGSQFFLDYHKSYLDDFVWPIINENDIDMVFCLGDFFDRRRTVDFLTMKYAIDIINKFVDAQLPFYSIVGNHDLFFRQSIDISGIEQLASVYDASEFTVVNQPELIGDHIVAIPWICNENKEKCTKFIQDNASNDKICLGHFELANFPILVNYDAPTGTIEKEIFKGYKDVISGHYHVYSQRENITYLGSATELTWNDYNIDKTIMLYDTNLMSFTMFHYDNPIFRKLVYPEYTDNQLQDICPGSFLKLIVNEIDDNLDNFIQDLKEKIQPSDLKIILPEEKMTLDDIQNINIEDPLYIMIKTIKSNFEEDQEYLIEQCIDIYKTVTQQIREN